MEQTESQFDVAHYLDVVRRRGALLFVTPLVCMLGAYLLEARGDELYRASAQVRVVSEQIDTEVELAQTESVRDRVEEALGDGADLIDGVSAQRVGETELVSISVTSTSPELAAEAANEWAGAFSETRNAEATSSLREERAELLADADAISPDLVALETSAGEIQETLSELDADAPENPGLIAELTTLRSETARLESQQRDLNDRATAIDAELFRVSRTVQLADPASVPGQPFSPKPLSAGATGLAAGIVLGLFAAAAAEIIDDPIWDATDAQRWIGDLPVIATIPPIPKWHDPARPFTLDEPGHAVSEAFRVLRTSLQFLSFERSIRTIMVTSADVGDGKTTTAINLAVVIARGGSDVVLVDGDLRRSSVHERVGLPNDVGLTSVLVGGAGIADATRSMEGLEPGALEVLPAGPNPPNPAELISSTGMRSLVNELASMSDTVIIDTPPMLAVSDSLAMAKHVDGALLVVRVRQTSGRALAAAVERIEQSDVRILGVVLNDDPEKSNDYLDDGGGHRSGIRGRRLARRGRATEDLDAVDGSEPSDERDRALDERTAASTASQHPERKRKQYQREQRPREQVD